MTSKKNHGSQKSEQDIRKDTLSGQLHGDTGGMLRRYRTKVLGSRAGFGQFLLYELANVFCVNLGGGAGFFLRKVMLPPLFQSCGNHPIFGKGLIIRKPGFIRLGNNISIDDYTMLDGGAEGGAAIRIGDRVVISRGCLIQAKTGSLEIGEDCDIGAGAVVASAGGIRLEPSVLVAGCCYIGGARYRLNETHTPIMRQGVYSRGEIRIGEGSWIGASAVILDGVAIGRGCVVGAGSVVTEDIPDYGVAVGNPARVVRIRE